MYILEKPAAETAHPPPRRREHATTSRRGAPRQTRDELAHGGVAMRLMMSVDEKINDSNSRD